MTRAYVTPFRTIKVRLETDPTDVHVFEVGRLVPCSTCGHPCGAHLGGRRKCVQSGCACPSYDGFRDYDAADLAAAVGGMAAFLARSNVTVAEVEGPHTYTDAAAIVGAVLAAIEDAGIAIDAPWRKEVMPTESGTPDQRSKSEARPLAAAKVEPSGAHSDSGVAPRERAQGAKGEAHAATPAAVAATSPAPRGLVGSTLPHEPPSPTVDLSGRGLRAGHPGPGPGRYAGIDPGTARIAVVIGETVAAAGGRPIFVASRVYAIGRVERIRGRNRHAFADDDVDVACAEIAMLLRAHGVTRAAIESSNGGMFGNAAEATRANHVGGVIYGYLRREGLACQRLTESTWYHRIVKGKRGKRHRADPKLLAALQAGFAGTWPVTSNEDVRDAGGVMLAMVTDPSPPKRSRPRPVVVQRPPHQRRAQARAAKRAAAGCTCRGTSTHRLDCPARKA